MVLWLRDYDLESLEKKIGCYCPYLLSDCKIKKKKNDWFSSKHDKEERFQQSGFCTIGRPTALKFQTGINKIETH